MHRSYQPILPSQNKFLQQRWDTKYYNEHRKKVREAVPVVDTKSPATFAHLHLRLKKLQLEEERLATIERDNRTLLEKMTYIMRVGGHVNNRNNYTNKSLNREKRERELQRVTKENHLILCRINMRKPEYSHQQLQLDWEKNQRFMDNISTYPIDWWVRERKTPRKVKSGKKPTRGEEDEHPAINDAEDKEASDKQTADGKRKDNEKDREGMERSGKKQKEEKRKKKDEKDAHTKGEKKEKEETKQLEVAVEDDEDGKKE